jgi:L-iditol 2-dehydrogenase
VVRVWAYLLTGPRRLDRVERPAPEPDRLAPGEVLLRTRAVGICGSDLPAYRGLARPPAGPDPASSHAQRVGQPAHEIAGDVIASADSRLRPGQAVVGWATGFDALQEFVVSRAEELAPYDPELTPGIAVLLQPLACALYVVEQLPQVRGARVAVLGLGSIGVLISHALAAAGAGTVVGVDPVDRRDVAARFGLDEVAVCDSGHWAAALDPVDRPAVVVECVGHQLATLRHAVDAVAFGGTIYYFGLPDDPDYPFPLWAFLRKNLTLRAGGTADRARLLSRADGYLAEHPELAHDYVTDVFGWDDVEPAFARAAEPAPGRLKVVVAGD